MKNLDYYLNLPYKIELKKIPEKEGGGYGALMPEFNGVAFFYGDGSTKQEALDDLEIAFKATLERLLKDNIKIPKPLDESEKIRINITIPKNLLNSIDAITKNRSAWISDLAKKALAN